MNKNSLLRRRLKLNYMLKEKCYARKIKRVIFSISFYKKHNSYVNKELLIASTIIWIIFIMIFWALINELSGNCLCVKHIPTPHFNYYEMHISLYIIRANSNLLNVNRTGILLWLIVNIFIIFQFGVSTWVRYIW